MQIQGIVLGKTPWEDSCETELYEADVGSGNYARWVEAYPTHSVEIFSDMLLLKDNICTKDVEYFTGKGVGLNEGSDWYSVESGATWSTPLCFACEYGNKDLIWILLECGADPNMCDELWSPIDYIVSSPYLDADQARFRECLYTLLRAKAEPKVARAAYDTLHLDQHPLQDRALQEMIQSLQVV